jgi:hypothetical protein
MKNNGEWTYVDGMSVENSKNFTRRRNSNFKNKKDSFLANAVRFRKGSRKHLAGNKLATNQKKGRRPEMPWQIIGMVSEVWNQCLA